MRDPRNSLSRWVCRELRGYLPEFTRAFNARAIMSNRIPDMEAAEDFPYCKLVGLHPNPR
jgi:hypothetical protein